MASYVFSVLCFCCWLTSEQGSSEATAAHFSMHSPAQNPRTNYFPEHLQPYLNVNTTEVLKLKTHHTLVMRYGTPHGMHINMEVLGSVVFEDGSQSCAQRTEEVEGNGCSVNMIIVFDLPVGVFVDPYELKVVYKAVDECVYFVWCECVEWCGGSGAYIMNLFYKYLCISNDDRRSLTVDCIELTMQSRHEFEWENVVVHTTTASLSHLSGEVFTRDASPFVLAVELLGVPLSLPVDEEDRVRGLFRFMLPLHLRYSSEFVSLSDSFDSPDSSWQTQSQCGPHRHKAHALVSHIPRPLVFAGFPYNPQDPSANWVPGVAFASSPSSARSRNADDADPESIQGLRDASTPDFYIRGEGSVSPHSPTMRAMHTSHLRTRYALSHTLGISDQQSSFSFSHTEYRIMLLSKDIALHRILDSMPSTLLQNSRSRDNRDSEDVVPLLFYEDTVRASCIYLPNQEGVMAVYLHMPVPNPHHVNIVVFITCLTILLTTTGIAYSLLIPPIRIRDK